MQVDYYVGDGRARDGQRTHGVIRPAEIDSIAIPNDRDDIPQLDVSELPGCAARPCCCNSPCVDSGYSSLRGIHIDVASRERRSAG